MRLIVNLPAFNEEIKLGNTIKRIPRTFRGIDDVLVQIIDDGSTDRTVEEARLADADIIVSHDGNHGLGVMFRTARESALENGADILVNIDADGQFDPNDIQKMIDPLLAHKADMVIADRFSEISAKNIPFIKEKLNRFGSWLVGKSLGKPVTDLTCGFRALNREALLRLNDPTGFTYTQETIIDAIGKNLKLLWVPVEVTYFEDRKSRVVKTIWKYVNNSTRVIIKAFRDIRPMKFFATPGVILITFACILFVLFLGLYFPDMKIAPYRNYLFASAIFFLIGLQLVIFGLIADMVKGSRILSEEILYRMRVEKYRK
ncbi:MAG: glycosyltransferase family 2 protein [Candidatus Moranbacteria bacterium]|nr:glycosyltransferase family 2 protein [Candidatus Moranbacteria bacterium]MDD3965119.1 glycosyltransferase family 2 protein [Candidatus Moranbacteria bacterium]